MARMYNRVKEQALPVSLNPGAFIQNISSYISGDAMIDIAPDVPSYEENTFEWDPVAPIGKVEKYTAKLGIDGNLEPEIQGWRYTIGTYIVVPSDWNQVLSRLTFDVPADIEIEIVIQAAARGAQPVQQQQVIFSFDLLQWAVKAAKASLTYSLVKIYGIEHWVVKYVAGFIIPSDIGLLKEIECSITLLRDRSSYFIGSQGTENLSVRYRLNVELPVIGFFLPSAGKSIDWPDDSVNGLEGESDAK